MSLPAFYTGRCDHRRAVPVESTMTGEILAGLCPDCDVQLSADFFGCPHDNTIDIRSLGERPGRKICNDCGTSGWYAAPLDAFPTIVNTAPPSTRELWL